MTINEAISAADRIREGNAYSEREKISWLNAVDGTVQREVVERHVRPRPDPEMTEALKQAEIGRDDAINAAISLINNRRERMRRLYIEDLHADQIDEALLAKAYAFRDTSGIFDLETLYQMELSYYSAAKQQLDTDTWISLIQSLNFVGKKQVFAEAYDAYSEAYVEAAAKIRELSGILLAFPDDGTFNENQLADLRRNSEFPDDPDTFSTISYAALDVAILADQWFEEHRISPDDQQQALIDYVWETSDESEALGGLYKAMQKQGTGDETILPIQNYYISQKLTEFAARSYADWETAFETELQGRISRINASYANKVKEIHDQYEYPEKGYDQDTDADHILLIPEPWSQCYVFYLLAQIDFFNQETFSYNNNMARFRAEFQGYTDYYNKTNKPIGAGRNERDIKWM